MITHIEDKKPTLEEAQELVGGYVTLIKLPDGTQMLVDEDGYLKEKKVNRDASVLGIAVGQPFIVGDVVILSGKARW
jgi:hypothetical protein